jgi:Uma2 family endonuclease
MSSASTTTPLTTSPSDLEPRLRRWTREEYYRLGDLGWFDGQRTELIEGEIMVLSPQRPNHSYVTDHVATVLRSSGWLGVWVRMQLPFDFGPYSDPEPDVSVVAGNSADYRDVHPATALLIIEVSGTTLAYDRGRKASLYAMRGVADYWIVNLEERQLEIHRDPRPDPAQPFGYGYANQEVLGPDGIVSPLAAPQVAISVTELLG